MTPVFYLLQADLFSGNTEYLMAVKIPFSKGAILDMQDDS